MTKIILASGSQQRRKLLELAGIDFSVEKSGAFEKERISSSCATLVKENAFAKAREVAGRHNSGLVIGADTVVYAGNKQLILKPKDYRDAKRILRVLFSRPTWVYTGLAIIDAVTERKIIGYEKTKVYMSRLSDGEIDSYHQKMHPFDKAGGFDIEGVGSLFIHRIEGCYTNVIGLPMAKLFQMLKKMGVKVL